MHENHHNICEFQNSDCLLHLEVHLCFLNKIAYDYHLTKAYHKTNLEYTQLDCKGT